MPYEYAWEKLHDAVHCLVGIGALRERVNRALLALLTLKVHKTGLPRVQDRLAKLLGAQASIDAMTEIELYTHANEIVDLYGVICRYREPLE